MRQPPILMYHWFRESGTPSRSRSPQLEIDPALFERQIAFLARSGYRSVNLRDVLPAAASPPPHKPIVITFDDGTLDFWESARPALERHGFTATLFVVTGRVGGRSDWDRKLGEPGRPLMSWDQIRELHEAGFEIGSHTHSHSVLTDLGESEAIRELARSREILADRLGRPPHSLAYPRGFFGEAHKRLARETGYRAACAVILRWRDLRRSDPFALRRMTIKGTESFGRFRLRLALSRVVPLQRS